MKARALKGPTIVKKVFIVILAIAGAAQVTRSAIVQQETAKRPELAAKFWPGHPRVEVALAMAEIGNAARNGRSPTAASVDRSETAARRSPLAVEPLLIKGAIAQNDKQSKRAELLFVEASRRDPRSSAARFFLAQLYLASERPGEGLRHAAVLLRLSSSGSTALVPPIAQYAKSPGAIPGLRRILAGDAALRDAVLSKLAEDAQNFSIIVALAGREMGSREPSIAPQWQAQLLRTLLEEGQLLRARALWLRISGLSSSPSGIFNPRFAKLAAPPPFNWTLGTGDFGFAEPAPQGGLQVIYYGRADGEFASQLLLLRPGSYVITMRVARNSDVDGASGLAWTIACSTSKNVLLNLALGTEKGAAHPITGRFTVPPGCSSQLVRLAGTAGEFPASEQVTISGLELVRQ